VGERREEYREKVEEAQNQPSASLNKKVASSLAKELK